MTAAHFLLLILINLIWGFNIIAAKVGVTALPPLFFTGLRFAVLSLILLPFLRIQRGQMGTIALIGFTAGGAHFALVFLGLARAGNISSVAIAMQLGPPFATILSVIFLKEAVGWLRWTGVGLAFAGVMLIAFDPAVFGYIDSLGLVVCAACTGAVGMLLMKQARGVGVLAMQSWLAFLSWPVLLMLSLVFESGQLAAASAASVTIWAALAYTAIAASLIGHGGLYFLLQRYDVSLIAPLTVLSTVFAVAFGVALLGDVLTWRIVAGGSVTLAGVALVARRQKQPVPPVTVPQTAR